jgi:hypothetical protein
MHIDRVRYTRGDKTYEQILLRESYREPGAKHSAVKKRTLLNLTKYPPQLVRAIEPALKHKEDLAALTSLKEVNIEQGRSVGGVFTPCFKWHGAAGSKRRRAHTKTANWRCGRSSPERCFRAHGSRRCDRQRGTVQPESSGSKKVESRGRHKEKTADTPQKRLISTTYSPFACLWVRELPL